MSDNDRKHPAKRTKRQAKTAAALEDDSAEDTTSTALLLLAAAGKKSPQDLADALMGLLLPQDATLSSKSAKNLLKSFDLVRAQLQHRTNLLSVNSIAKGKQSDMVLSGFSIPAGVMQNVLEFLPRASALRSASLVGKSWLAMVRAPEFWTALDHNAGLLEISTTVTNMTQFLKVVKQPQFAWIKKLGFPETVRSRKKAFEEIAKACPLLEEIDVGSSLWSTMKIDQETFLSLPVLFPRLNAIRLSLYYVTDFGIGEFCRIMGDRLVRLGINEAYGDNNSLSNDFLAPIGNSCPNLESFAFHFVRGLNCPPALPIGRFSDAAIIRFLESCPKLKTLSLFHCDENVSENFGLSAFEYIRDNANRLQLEKVLVTGHSDLMADTELCAKLKEKLPSFEAITNEDFNLRVVNLHSNNKASDHLAW